MPCTMMKGTGMIHLIRGTGEVEGVDCCLGIPPLFHPPQLIPINMILKSLMIISMIIRQGLNDSTDSSKSHKP